VLRLFLTSRPLIPEFSANLFKLRSVPKLHRPLNYGNVFPIAKHCTILKLLTPYHYPDNKQSHPQCPKPSARYVQSIHLNHHPSFTHTSPPPQTRLAYARTWHHVSLSASPLTLGRVSSRIALILMGKHKPVFDPSSDCGDYVVATDCAQLKVSGRKLQQKTYYSHTTRPGSLKALSLERLMAKWGGGEALRRCVRGMLPKNKLRDGRLARLKSRSLRARAPRRWPRMEVCVADGDSSVRGPRPSLQAELAEISRTESEEPA